MDILTVTYLLLAILGLGTIYVWYQFYKIIKNQCDTCSVGLHQSPFRSKCFVGAIFFTIAFALSIYIFILI